MNSSGFTRLRSVAAPLPLSNVDTDKIFPAEYLKTTERRGLGKWLFATMRFRDDGTPDPDFILNRAPWTKAAILVALDNFGSGSSREHAPWALKDFGIRAIIAPSFADIFRQNCVKNGILPAEVDVGKVHQIIDLVSVSATSELAIDLEARTISDGCGSFWHFRIDDIFRDVLLTGRDEITTSLEHSDEIDRHFNDRRIRAPWILPVRFP